MRRRFQLLWRAAKFYAAVHGIVVALSGVGGLALGVAFFHVLTGSGWWSVLGGCGLALLSMSVVIAIYGGGTVAGVDDQMYLLELRSILADADTFMLQVQSGEEPDAGHGPHAMFQQYKRAVERIQRYRAEDAHMLAANTDPISFRSTITVLIARTQNRIDGFPTSRARRRHGRIDPA